MNSHGDVLKSSTIHPLLNPRSRSVENDTHIVREYGPTENGPTVTEYGLGPDAMDVDVEIMDQESKGPSTVPRTRATSGQNGSRTILHQIPGLLPEIFQYLNQYDLVRLSQVCRAFYIPAIQRLYKRVTVILNAEFPLRYHRNPTKFIQDNGIKHMDTALILAPEKLLRFLEVLKHSPDLVQRVKFFVFDKCHANSLDTSQISVLQNQIIEFFGTYSTEINFLHITFIDFLMGIEKLTTFLRNENVRNRIFKLFVTNIPDLYRPVIPQGLTNLFLMLDEGELMKYDHFDLASDPFLLFNSLFTLTCSTNNQFGLEILNKLRLMNGEARLKLKGLTVFHCHKEGLLEDENNLHHDIFTRANHTGPGSETEYIQSLDKRLRFNTLESKIDLTYLSNLYLKIDCNEHRNNNCQCFPTFFKDLTTYSEAHEGLPNLISFELELFPNLEWLRPHQLLENILTQLGNFIKSLASLSRLTIDFSTPGFKMFDNSMGMDSLILNRLNERLMEAFFLCFLSSNGTRTVMNLKTLQLPDFLTSFIYYKPDFYESLLHTCKCWGCQRVLDKLKEMFYPLTDEEEENEMDLQSTYYILIGFILGKLQADREVCVPIKQRTFSYRNYPIYKGQRHTLHSHFHKEYSKECDCEQESGTDEYNIDNLVTVYIIHQLRPIIGYLSMIFFKLENLMIHGVYYEFVGGRLVPIYDEEEYPGGFSEPGEPEGEPDGPFGKFRIP